MPGTDGQKVVNATLRYALIGGVCLLLGGCTLPTRRVSRTEILEADMRALEQEVAGIQSRLEALEEAAADLRTATQDAVEAADSRYTARLQRLENRVQQLEQMLARESRQRAKDREEIVNSLSRRMEKAIRRYCAGRAGGRTLSGEGYEHVVQPGETLSEIAKAYGVTVRAIVEANDIPDPDRLQVGQRLFIPQ